MDDLGKKVPPPAPPVPREWWPVEDKPHLERNAKGQLRTCPPRKGTR